MIIIKNSIFNSATYILSNNNTKNAILIDCGDIDPINRYLEDNHLNLKGVLITHTHFDHIYGLNELIQKYPYCKLYTSEHGAEGLRNPKLNMSRYHDDVEDINYQFYNLEILSDRQEVEVDGEHIKILETPGHDWSCLTYHIGKNLFTGDSYIPNTKPQYSFPKGDKRQYYNSEKRIIEYAQTFNLTIKPGHII